MENQFDGNNIENENINQINLNNENMNEQNIDNNNGIIDNNFFNKNQNITISFLIFLIINIIVYSYSKVMPIETSKYIFQFVPIIEKKQYYRIVTRYFIHFGIFHLLIELTSFFYLCKHCENMLGTLLTLSLIFVCMILDSLIHLLIIPIISFFLRGRFSTIANYIYEGGLTPIIFTLLTYISLYNKNRNEQLSFESLIILKARYLYLYLLGVLYFFTPNRTFYGNVSGIIGGFILKKYPKYILPKIKWIKEMEECYSLEKIKILYIYLNINNDKMREALKEYDEDSIDEINENDNINEENNNKKNNIEFSENDDNNDNNYINS